MAEGKDNQGYVWIRDQRDDEYYYLQDFENLIVMKVAAFSERLPAEHWEAVVFEDESCQKVLGRQEFATKEEAQASLERIMELSLKNRKNLNL